MKTYLWHPSGVVTVLNGSRTRTLPAVHVYAAAFSCGPDGSFGSYDLALSILLDCQPSKTAKDFHIDFARRVLSNKYPAEHWQVTSEEIAVWLALRREEERRAIGAELKQDAV